MADKSDGTVSFLFRRDLELADNPGLLGALEQRTRVLLLFFPNPKNADRAVSIVRIRCAATQGSASSRHDAVAQRLP